MKMNMKKYFFLLVAAVMTLTACEDWLDKTPQSQLTPDTFFKTEGELQLFANQFYSSAFGTTVFNAMQTDTHIQDQPSSELRGGNNRSVTATSSYWNFSLIRKCYILIGYADNCPDEAAREKYKAIAKFFIVQDYYDKVRRFGDVPWIDHELASDEEEALYGGRVSRDEIMEHMIKMIDEAIAVLPAAKSPFTVNKWTALALKSRFCLFEGTWRKYHNVSGLPHDANYYLNLCAEASQTFITSSPYKIYSTGKPTEDYVNMFAAADANSDEFILSHKYDKGLNLKHNATWYGIGQSVGRAGMTKKMVDSYLMADGTRFTDKEGWDKMQFAEETSGRDPRLGQSIRVPGYKRINGTATLTPEYSCSITGFQIVKFVQAADAGTDAYGESFNDLCFYRAAEVYLNYAEAKAELGSLSQADIDMSIKPLRDRVGMPNLDMAAANANPDWYLSSKEYGYQNVTGANKGVILEIRRERAVELAQEGDTRWFDLMRWKEGNCINQNFYGPYFPGPGEYDLDGDGDTDLILYPVGEAAPAGGEGIEVRSIGDSSKADVMLTNGVNGGYVDPYKLLSHEFNESRDYLYPIPINDRSVYHSHGYNLPQNPGWNDGLDF